VGDLGLLGSSVVGQEKICEPAVGGSNRGQGGNPLSYIDRKRRAKRGGHVGGPGRNLLNTQGELRERNPGKDHVNKRWRGVKKKVRYRTNEPLCECKREAIKIPLKRRKEIV